MFARVCAQDRPARELSSKVKNMSQKHFYLNRRDFLGAASVLTLAPAVYAAPDNTIKLGLVGCGGRGTGAANHALNVGDDIRLVAVCDVDRVRADQAVKTLSKEHAKNVDVPADRVFDTFDGYKKVIAQSDVVILATSPGFRPQHFEEAVKQGKHVFMEKPVATDVAGIKRMLANAKVARKKGLKVGVGLQRRHHPSYQDVVKRIQDGAIGEIHTMRALWDGTARGGKERIAGETELQYQIRNWYYFTWLSGDHNVEQHVHNLDVVNWIKGAHPVRAQGMGGREVRNALINGQIFDHHFIEYEYEDGTLLYSQARQIPGCWRSISEHVYGSKGAAHLEQRYFEITGPNAFENRLRKREDAHQLEHYPFFDAIRKDEPYDETEAGATATMTAILGRMATYSAQSVTWEDAMASDLRLVPDDIVDFRTPPPVLPDAEGWYPVAVPGVTKPYEVWY